MLVLTRRPDESLVFLTVDGKITIRINEVDKGQVKLTVEAPKAVRLMRDQALARQIAAMHTV